MGTNCTPLLVSVLESIRNIYVFSHKINFTEQLHIWFVHDYVSWRQAHIYYLGQRILRDNLVTITGQWKLYYSKFQACLQIWVWKIKIQNISLWSMIELIFKHNYVKGKPHFRIPSMRYVHTETISYAGTIVYFKTTIWNVTHENSILNKFFSIKTQALTLPLN